MVKFWVGLALLIAAVATLSHCHGPVIGSPFDFSFDFLRDRGTQGSGVAANESRLLGEFSRIHAEGASNIDVQVREGLPRAIEITSDDNLLSIVRTDIVAGVLEISPAVNINPVSDLRIRITAPSLAGIHLEGANKLELDIDSTSDLDVRLEGASRVRAKGRLGKFVVRTEGAGTIDAADLVARAVDVHIEGAGRANVHATESLKARIEGAGIIRYGGNPPNVEKDVEGFGRISRRD